MHPKLPSCAAPAGQNSTPQTGENGHPVGGTHRDLQKPEAGGTAESEQVQFTLKRESRVESALPPSHLQIFVGAPPSAWSGLDPAMLNELLLSPQIPA